MTKRKDMTPSELAAWKQKRNERERQKRHADPEYRASVNARNNKSQKKCRATNSERNERERAYSRKRSQRSDVKKKNAVRMRTKYQTDKQYAEEQRLYWAKKREEPGYKTVRLAKQREYGKKYKEKRRLNEEFEAFMSRINAEESVTCITE